MIMSDFDTFYHSNFLDTEVPEVLLLFVISTRLIDHYYS